MCRPAAISSVDAGSRLTCRKRKILSELRWEGRGIGGGVETVPCWDSTEIFFRRVKLFLTERGFISRPTHNRLAALRQAGRCFPETGKLKGGGTTWPASLFLFIS